jgi:polysaccharide biosynthesis transport protein
MESQVAQDVREYLGILHKRRATVVTSLGLSLLIAVLYNYTTRPLYQASVQLLIDPAVPRVLPAAQTIDPGVQDYETEYALLRGQKVAARVIEKLELQKSPELMTGPLMTPWERFQRKFLGRVPTVDVGRDGIPLSPAVAALRSRIGIEPLPGGRLVNIRITAYDPTIAAEIANTLGQVYIDQSMEFRFDASTQATDWLSGRLAEQKRKVEEAEKALIAYQERYGLTDAAATGGPSSNKSAALENALIAARTERIAKESLLNQAHSTSPLSSIPSLLAMPGVHEVQVKLAELQSEQTRLGESLGERHPDMVQLRAEIAAAEGKLQAELRGAVRALEADTQAARSKEASISADLERAWREGLDVGRKAIEYQALKREVETNKQLFQTVMSRAKETGLESELRATNVRIVERAEAPRGPASPNRRRNYVMALVIGLALGIGLAILFEHADNTIKNPDDVRRLDLPFLAMVPSVSQGSGTLPSKALALRNPDGHLAEAYRVLRTNLIFSMPADKGRVVIVSSANPGEGKTTTAANLAAALSMNGAKVLVLDADLRRPTLHQHLGVQKAPGLSDVIVGRNQPADVIQATRYKGLYVLPCGHAAPNPAELLDSNAMRDIVGGLKHHYDWVLVDTPPILAMADTPILCPIADGVLLVLAAEVTLRPAIERARDQILAVGGKVTGAVLNKVDLKRNSYYYSHSYGEYYRNYYAEGSENRPSGLRAVRRG